MVVARSVDLHPITGIGLCAGVGWLDLAVKLTWDYFGFEYRTVCFAERDSYTASVLLARMEDKSLEPAAICDSLEDIDGRFAGVDCVVAGFPCQPWSVAGSRRGIEDERWIWPDIVRIVREVGPRFVFLENVPGLVAGDGSGIGSVLDSLAELGFDAEWTHLSAAEVGASHKRERWFYVAYRSRQAIGESSGQLADTGDQGLPQRGSQRRDDGEEFATAQRSGVPLFAPGPNSHLWRDIPEWLWPAVPKATQSSVRQFPHGKPMVVDEARADQLRCSGNGVVVLQAATAFVGLMRRVENFRELILQSGLRVE